MGNMSLVRVGGVCAILVTVSIIVAIIFRGATDLPGLKDLTDDAERWLLSVDANRTAFLSYMWFLLLGSVLLIPAALGFYQALRVAGALLWIAVAAMFTGALLYIASNMTLIGMAYELVPGYVEASETIRPALAAMASTLGATSRVALTLAGFPFLGIGLALFSLAVLRTSVVPRWVGWLGLAAALLGGWPQPLRDVSEVFTAVGGLGLLVFLVWMAAMGVALLRLKEPATPDSAA